MRPLKKNLAIVKAALNQRETLQFGTLNLFIPNRSLLNQNGRVSEPTICEVVSSLDDQLQPGDVLLLGHNSIGNTASKIEDSEGVRTLALYIDRWVLGKIDRSNGNVTPLFGNTVAKRLSQRDASSIIITPDAYKKTEENKVEILSVASDVTEVKAGDIALIHQYADYEIFYNWNGQERSAIIVWSKDIVASTVIA